MKLEDNEMFSACFARLGTALSGLKLQAIINAQIDEKNCLEWGNRIPRTDYFAKIQSVHPIHKKGQSLVQTAKSA